MAAPGLKIFKYPGVCPGVLEDHLRGGTSAFQSMLSACFIIYAKRNGTTRND